MATVFEIDGSRRTVQPATPPAFTLEELQQLVGGYIELSASSWRRDADYQ